VSPVRRTEKCLQTLHDPRRLSDFQLAAFNRLPLQATDGQPERSTMRYVSPEELGANSPSFAGAFDSVTPYHADGVVERLPIDVEPQSRTGSLFEPAIHLDKTA